MADGYYETIRDEYGNQEKRWVNTGDEYLEIYDPGYGITYKIANPNYRTPAPMSQYSGSARTDVYWTDINPAPSNDPNYQPTMGWYVPEYERISANMKVPEKGKYEVKENLWDNTIDKSYSRYTQYEDGKPVRSWTEYPEEHGSSGGIGGFVSSYVNPLGAYVPQVALAAPVIAASILQPELAPAMAGFMGASQGYGGSGAGSREDVSYASGIVSALTRGAIAAGTTALAQGMLSGSTPTGGGVEEIGKLSLASPEIAAAEFAQQGATMPSEIGRILLDNQGGAVGSTIAGMTPEIAVNQALAPGLMAGGLGGFGSDIANMELALQSPIETSPGYAPDIKAIELTNQGGAIGSTLENATPDFQVNELLSPENILGAGQGSVATTDNAQNKFTKELTKKAMGMINQGASVKSPSFNISFNPLTAKTWNYTPTNFATSAGADQAGGSTIPGASPFTGIGLLIRDQEKKKLGLLPYLRDYIA